MITAASSGRRSFCRCRTVLNTPRRCRRSSWSTRAHLPEFLRGRIRPASECAPAGPARTHAPVERLENAVRLRTGEECHAHPNDRADRNCNEHDRRVGIRVAGRKSPGIVRNAIADTTNDVTIALISDHALMRHQYQRRIRTRPVPDADCEEKSPRAARRSRAADVTPIEAMNRNTRRDARDT